MLTKIKKSIAKIKFLRHNDNSHVKYVEYGKYVPIFLETLLTYRVIKFSLEEVMSIPLSKIDYSGIPFGNITALILSFIIVNTAVTSCINGIANSKLTRSAHFDEGNKIAFWGSFGGFALIVLIPFVNIAIDLVKEGDKIFLWMALITLVLTVIIVLYIASHLAEKGDVNKPNQIGKQVNVKKLKAEYETFLNRLVHIQDDELNEITNSKDYETRNIFIHEGKIDNVLTNESEFVSWWKNFFIGRETDILNNKIVKLTFTCSDLGVKEVYSSDSVQSYTNFNVVASDFKKKYSKTIGDKNITFHYIILENGVYSEIDHRDILTKYFRMADSIGNNIDVQIQ